MREGEGSLYEQSLAQLIANTSRATVWAFPRRSNYDQTYGNATDRANLGGAMQRVQADKLAMNSYEQQVHNYQMRLAAHRQTSGNANAQLPNETPPSRPIKAASAEDEVLARHAKSRDTNDRTIGYPLDAEGAVRPVRAGDSSTGVPATLREYKPL